MHIALRLASLLSTVFAACVVNQTCVYENGVPTCGANYKVDPPFQPSIQTMTPPNMCPEFEGNPVCCFNYDNYQLISQFMELDYTFGGNNGGCDVCAANMKRFWCYFVCSPQQSDFLSIGNYTWVPNPISPGSLIQVLEINFTITMELACGMYESCKKCPYTQEVSSMQSAEGFLQFQGTNSAIGGELITFFFLTQGTQGALNINMAPCNYKKPELAGIPISPCSCNK